MPTNTLSTPVEHLNPTDVDIERIVYGITDATTSAEAHRIVNKLGQQRGWLHGPNTKDFIDDDFAYGELAEDDDLAKEYLERPTDQFMLAVHELFDKSVARVFDGTSGGVQHYRELITRHRKQSGQYEIDSKHRIVETEDGSPLITVESYLQGRFTQPVTFSIASNGLRIVLRHQSNPAKDVDFAITPGEVGERLYLGQLVSMKWAADLALQRSVEGNQAEADASAFQLLAADRKAVAGREAGVLYWQDGPSLSR